MKMNDFHILDKQALICRLKTDTGIRRPKREVNNPKIFNYTEKRIKSGPSAHSTKQRPVSLLLGISKDGDEYNSNSRIY